MNREYRQSDFKSNISMQLLAVVMGMFYGVAIGIAGTLFVQWILA